MWKSKADFIHKMQPGLKELRESLYWLKLAKRTDLIPGKELQTLLNEADKFIKIVAKSVIIAKGKKK